VLRLVQPQRAPATSIRQQRHELAVAHYVEALQAELVRRGQVLHLCPRRTRLRAAQRANLCSEALAERVEARQDRVVHAGQPALEARGIGKEGAELEHLDALARVWVVDVDCGQQDGAYISTERALSLQSVRTQGKAGRVTVLHCKAA
jgi:hypothetical protein